MENKPISFNDIGIQQTKLTSQKKVNFTAKPDLTQKDDTIEINGEVKTDKKKKKLSADKKVFMALGGISLAGIIAGVVALKKGKIRAANKIFDRPAKFSHEPLLTKVPTTQELDAKVAEKIKDVKLDYGFDENITDFVNIKKVLKDIYPNSSNWSLDPIAIKAEQNADVRHVLRTLTGKNFATWSDNSKKSVEQFWDVERIVNGIKGPIDRNEFDNAIKLISLDTWQWHTADSLGNNIHKLKDMNHLQVLSEVLKNTDNITSDISDFTTKKDFKLDDLLELFSTIKKGTLSDKYGYLKTYELGNLIKDEKVDIKSVTKFLKSLNNDTIEHVKIPSIKEIYKSGEISPKAAAQKLNGIPKKTLAKMTGDYDAANYLRFEEFMGKKNINELTLAEKKKLMDKLIKNNSRSFDNGLSDDSGLFKLVPNNKKQYCAILEKLAKSIGISTKKLTAAELQTFENGLQDLNKHIGNIDFNKVELKLNMSRQDFTKKAQNIMSNLDDNEKRRVMDYFGFEINNNKLKGYPINLNNGEKLAEIADNKTKAVIEKLRPVVVEFSEKNPVTVVNGDKAFEKALNEVLVGLPELRTMIGKPQHATHAYSLDLHTLKVLQGVTSNPKFAALSKEDKKIISIASLLHDVTKTEGLRDPLHPMESAFDAYYIIQKMNLREDQQLKVYELIKSHNWLDRLNNPKNTPEVIERIAQDVAFDARHTNTFELAKILCEADLKAVRNDATFFNKHKATLQTMSDKVDGYLRRIHETQITLPQTRMPKASQLTGAETKSADGITNKVIYMNKAPQDLNTIGFDKGTTKDNWRGLVHALDNEEQMQKFNTFSIIDTEALLSTSYMDAKNYRVFRKQGFVLDVDFNDIHAGYYRDFGTGYAKDIELLKSDYLFKGQRAAVNDKNAWTGDRREYRDYIPNLVKQKMGINNAQYVELMEKIQSCKSITDIEKVDKRFADNLQEIFAGMDAGRRNGGRQYNEMLVTRPKIQAVFAYDKDYNKIPHFLRKYAADNDLPIIIFGK